MMNRCCSRTQISRNNVASGYVHEMIWSGLSCFNDVGLYVSESAHVELSKEAESASNDGVWTRESGLKVVQSWVGKTMNSNPRFDSCDDMLYVADLRRLAAVVGAVARVKITGHVVVTNMCSLLTLVVNNTFEIGSKVGHSGLWKWKKSWIKIWVFFILNIRILQFDF